MVDKTRLKAMLLHFNDGQIARCIHVEDGWGGGGGGDSERET